MEIIKGAKIQFWFSNVSQLIHSVVNWDIFGYKLRVLQIFNFVRWRLSKRETNISIINRLLYAVSDLKNRLLSAIYVQIFKNMTLVRRRLHKIYSKISIFSRLLNAEDELKSDYFLTFMSKIQNCLPHTTLCHRLNKDAIVYLCLKLKNGMSAFFLLQPLIKFSLQIYCSCFMTPSSLSMEC